MKNNIKLFFKSLISNNACIDGAKKKPWYTAIIIFFLSLIVALVPTFVKTIKVRGSDSFATYNYGLAEATRAFEENIESNGVTFTVIDSLVEEKEKNLVCSGDNYVFTYTNANGSPEVNFRYIAEPTDEEINSIMKSNTSELLFTSKNFYLHLVNFNSSDKTVLKDLGCIKAYKYLDTGYTLNSLVAKNDDGTVSTADTWSNWLKFYDKAYNFDRLTVLWQQCLIIGCVDIAITVLMGFMIWVLTRGKNNPYKLIINFWEGQKIAYWSAVAPAILTCGLGFLLSSFSNALFALLIGIRIMWLSTKSLRPDGSGYAAS